MTIEEMALIIKDDMRFNPDTLGFDFKFCRGIRCSECGLYMASTINGSRMCSIEYNIDEDETGFISKLRSYLIENYPERMI